MLRKNRLVFLQSTKTLLRAFASFYWSTIRIANDFHTITKGANLCLLVLAQAMGQLRGGGGGGGWRGIHTKNIVAKSRYTPICKYPTIYFSVKFPERWSQKSTKTSSLCLFPRTRHQPEVQLRKSPPEHLHHFLISFEFFRGGLLRGSKGTDAKLDIWSGLCPHGSHFITLSFFFLNRHAKVNRLTWWTILSF